MAYPRFQRARNFTTLQIVSADTTLNATTADTFQDFGTPARTTIEAQTGDILEIRVVAFVGTPATGTAAFKLRPYTYVGSTKTNICVPFSPPAYSAPSAVAPAGWWWSGVTAQGIDAYTPYPVQASDVSSGLVTIGLEWTQDASTNQTFFGTTWINALIVGNRGPVQPH